MNKVFMTIFALLLLAVTPIIGNAEASTNQNPEMSFVVDVTESDMTVVADHKPIGVEATVSIGELFALGCDDNDKLASAIIPSRFKGTYLEGNLIHFKNDIHDERQYVQTPAFIKRE